MLSDFQFVIELPLLTIGLTWIVWLLYKWLRNSLGKKNAGRDEKILVLFFGGFACFLVVYLWLIPVLLNNDISRSQYNNCRDTRTEDGDRLTDDQCRYFQDVLNGKYIGQ